MSTFRTDTSDPQALFAFPDGEAEMRDAAEELARAAGKRSEAPTRDERINRALGEMRHGDVRVGFMRLAELATAGEPVAPHLIAWLQRYRAVAVLQASVRLFDLAVERGYEPSRLHRERVVAMLDVPMPEVPTASLSDGQG